MGGAKIYSSRSGSRQLGMPDKLGSASELKLEGCGRNLAGFVGKGLSVASRHDSCGEPKPKTDVCGGGVSLSASSTLGPKSNMGRWVPSWPPT
jgi:hypothetical protein